MPAYAARAVPLGDLSTEDSNCTPDVQNEDLALRAKSFGCIVFNEMASEAGGYKWVFLLSQAAYGAAYQNAEGGSYVPRSVQTVRIQCYGKATTTFVSSRGGSTKRVSDYV